MGIRLTSLYRFGNHAPPECAGTADIAEDLRFERGGIGEVLLRADETAETDLNMRGRKAIERGEKKSLDCEFITIECGARAGVGDGGPDSTC